MKRLCMAAIAAAALFSLSACGTNGGFQIGGSGSAVSDLVQFTDADLDNALATAQAYPNVSPNQMVIQCIPTFKAWIDSLPGANGSIKVSGLASGMEAAIVYAGTVQSGIPDSVYVACGPLYAKEHAKILKFLGGKTLGIGTGGIL